MEEGGKVEHTSLKDLQEAYKEVVQEYFPAELRKRENITAISVGCGMAAEAQAFTGLGQPEVYYEGIDNQGVIGAQAVNSQLPPDRFRIADATDLDSFGGQLWDLVILRNPQIRIQTGGVSDEWKKIFINCVNSLKDNGYIFLTTTSHHEMKATVSFLQGLGLTEVLKQQPLMVDLGKFPLREQDICVLQKKADQLQSS